MNKFSTLCELLSNLTSPTEARGQIAEYLTHLSPDDQAIACKFIIGQPLDGNKTGYSKKTVDKVNFVLTNHEYDYTLGEIYAKYSALAASGSNKELRLQQACINMANREYFIKILLGNLRNGIGKNVITHSLARIYNTTSNNVADLYKKVESIDKVIAILNGEEDKIQIGIPIKPQLAKDISKHMNRIQYPVIIEPKYDGIRAQVHIHLDGRVEIFSRSLKNKTAMYPDIVLNLSESNLESGIYDGEIYGINPNGSLMPFEKFQHRINSESDLDRLVKEYPCMFRAFDALYINPHSIITWSQEDRQDFMHTYNLTCVRETANNERELLEIYNKCIYLGYEGIMIKNPQGLYEPGKGKSEWGNWFKYKPARITFDVVITSARFGDGKNSDVLASFDIAVLDKGSLYPVGACGLGFDRKDMEYLTDRITSNMIAIGWTKEGNDCCKVDISNSIIIEVMADKVMHNDSGGYGLRFPRFVRFRPDKELGDIDTIEMVKEYDIS